MPDFVTPQLVTSVIVILVMLKIILLSCSYLIMLERKVCAWIQDRIGPNRTNLSFGILPIKKFCFGLGQPLADGIKLFLKEDYTPNHVDKPLFILAPILVVIPAMIGWAIMPWGGIFISDGFTFYTWIPFIGGHVVAPFKVLTAAAGPLNVGVIYILAVGSLAVYGVGIGGYASNNKYSFLGALRATSQMLSYEIPMGLAVLTIIITCGGAMSANGIIDAQVYTQGGAWGILTHPLFAIIFFTCILAECNRAPFDLAEAEQELVGGFHTEYSSMKWALFFLGEYMEMITGAAFFTLIFLGGWAIPFVDLPAEGGIFLVLLKTFAFIAKMAFLLFLMMQIRWTLPRFRFDQLMKLAWQVVIPTSLVLLLATTVLVFYGVKSWYVYSIMNFIVLGGNLACAKSIPTAAQVNKKIPLAGSRFSPITEPTIESVSNTTLEN